MSTRMWRAARMWCTSITCCGPQPSSTLWPSFWASLPLRCWGASKTWWVKWVIYWQRKCRDWILPKHCDGTIILNQITSVLNVLVRLPLLPQKAHLSQRPSQLHSPQSFLHPPLLPSTHITALLLACHLTRPTTCRYRSALNLQYCTCAQRELGPNGLNFIFCCFFTSF